MTNDNRHVKTGFTRLVGNPELVSMRRIIACRPFDQIRLRQLADEAMVGPAADRKLGQTRRENWLRLLFRRSLGGGPEWTCEALLSILINYGFLVFSLPDDSGIKFSAHYGAICAGAPEEERVQ